MSDLPRFVDYLKLENGKQPFRAWFENLDARSQQTVDAAIYKVRRGLRKPVKALKDGVYEIKIDFGPGIRVYFGEDGPEIILLIGGGTKRSQEADVREAKKLWKSFMQRKRK